MPDSAYVPRPAMHAPRAHLTAVHPTLSADPLFARSGRILVVLPTYNEAGNIVALCEQILESNPLIDVLVVDDQSPDGTALAVQRLQERSGQRLQVEVRPRRLGRGNAVQYGLAQAQAWGYEFAIEMDADFSHDPRDIPLFLAAIPDADVVIGSRHLLGGGFVGWNWRRKLVHWMAACFTDLILETPTTDHTNGFRCYRVAHLPAEPLRVDMARGFADITLRAYQLHRAGLRFKEVPVYFYERRAGASKMSLREAIGGAFAIVRHRFRHRGGN